jgi:hypothetical protein
MFSSVALVVAAVLVLVGVGSLVAVGVQVARVGLARCVQWVNRTGAANSGYIPPGSR